MRRKLLINVDDIGIYPESVRPAVETMIDGIAASGSVMTVSSAVTAPCPFLPRALTFPWGCT